MPREKVVAETKSGSLAGTERLAICLAKLWAQILGEQLWELLPLLSDSSRGAVLLGSEGLFTSFRHPFILKVVIFTTEFRCRVLRV